MRRILTLIVVGFLGTAAFMGLTEGKERVLRFQVNYAGVSHGGDTMRYFAEQLANLSGGSLKCELFWEGQIIKTAESFSALQKGMVDGLYSALLYFSGVVKEGGWEWIPFAWDNTEQIMAIYYDKGVFEAMDRALKDHGVKFLGAIPMGTLSFMTRFPVTSINDFKGKKIRASGAQARLVQSMGGAPVAMAAAEQYVALQKGVIDGTIYPLYTIKGYKFYEVITNVVQPGVHSPCVIDLMMNRATWDSLTEQERDFIQKAARKTVEWGALKTKEWDEEGLSLAEQYKIKISRLSTDEIKELRALTKPLWEEEASKSEISAAIVRAAKSVVGGE